jgi:phage-related protein
VAGRGGEVASVLGGRARRGRLSAAAASGWRDSVDASFAADALGAGCHELRIVDRDSTWRIVYFVEREAVVILEVFSKKTRETPKQVIETCKSRLRLYRAMTD